jgi:hypothetical protein
MAPLLKFIEAMEPFSNSFDMPRLDTDNANTKLIQAMSPFSNSNQICQDWKGKSIMRGLCFTNLLVLIIGQGHQNFY